jgi:hypothetical protein
VYIKRKFISVKRGTLFSYIYALNTDRLSYLVKANQFYDMPFNYFLKIYLNKHFKFNPFVLNFKQFFLNYQVMENVQYKITSVEQKYTKSPLIDKFSRFSYLDGGASLLYGYKFHIHGRFARKQRAVNI